MQIKNNTASNLSVYAKSTRGKSGKKYLTVVGGSTLVLDDKEYLKEYEDSIKKQVKAKNLTITVPAKKSEGQIRADKELALAAAKALIAEAEAEAKAVAK